MQRHITWGEVQTALMAWLADVAPHQTPLKLRVYLHRGRRVEMPIVWTLPDDDVNGVAPELRDLILQTLADAGEPIKTSAIARRAQRNYDEHFRRVIKLMREAGEIVLDAAGLYSLPKE